MTLTATENIFWNKYIKSLPYDQRLRTVFVEAGYCGSRDITNSLIALYLSYKKSAGSSLVADFAHHADPLPKVGNYWIALDSGDNPKLILKTVSVEFNRFGAMPERIAKAEGEGDCSLAHWKAVHERHWAPYLQKWGVANINNAEVVTEFYQLVFK